MSENFFRLKPKINMVRTHIHAHLVMGESLYESDSRCFRKGWKISFKLLSRLSALFVYFRFGIWECRMHTYDNTQRITHTLHTYPVWDKTSTATLRIHFYHSEPIIWIFIFVHSPAQLYLSQLMIVLVFSWIKTWPTPSGAKACSLTKNKKLNERK